MAQTAFFEFFLTNLRFVLASGAENGLKTWFLNPAIFAILHNVRDLRDWNTKWSAKRASKMQKKEAKLPFYLLFQRSGRDSNPRAVARKLISSQPRYDLFDTAAFMLLRQFPVFCRSLEKSLLSKNARTLRKNKLNFQDSSRPNPLKNQGIPSDETTSRRRDFESGPL